MELQLRTAKNAFADVVKNAKALSAVKDVQELTEVQTSIAQPVADTRAWNRKFPGTRRGDEPQKGRHLRKEESRIRCSPRL
jgi:NRPS condensation-like uncharacterized protein